MFLDKDKVRVSKLEITNESPFEVNTFLGTKGYCIKEVEIEFLFMLDNLESLGSTKTIFNSSIGKGAKLEVLIVT